MSAPPSAFQCLAQSANMDIETTIAVGVSTGSTFPSGLAQALEHQRGHASAFAVLARYTQGAEPRPGRRRAGRRGEPRVTRHRAPAPLPVEQRLEGGTPAGAEGGNAQCLLELAARMSRHIQQPIG